MKKLLFILLFIPYSLFATNYYVKTAGSDGANGLTDGTAWATLSKVSGFTFTAGDTIFLNKGDTWRETLTIHNSGSAGAWITYKSYGTGAKPKILGSTQAITWSDMTGSVWKSATSVTDPYAAGTKGSEIFFNSSGTITWGRTKKADTASLAQEYDWTWSGNYLYVYAATDPDARYTAIEAPQRTWGIDLNDKEYIIIDGLEVQHCQNGNIGGGGYPTPDKSWMIIKNCSSSYCGIKDGDNLGISACYSNMVIQNNIVHDIGRRSISIYGYGNGGFRTHNIIVEGNTLYNGTHTTGIDMSCGSGSFTQYFDSVVVRNNLIYDSPTASVTSPEGGTPELINIESYYSPTVRIQNLYIYNNILKYPSNSAIHIYGIDGVDVFNNTFYGHNENATGNTAFLKITSGCTDVVIKNNIFYTPLNVESNSRGNSIYTTSTQPTANLTVDYNIYYRVNATYRVVELLSGTTTYHYNDLAAMQAAGWETHGVFADPSFENTDSLYLNVGSPAIAGIDMGLTTDIYGNMIGATPVIGAVAVYGSTPEDPAPPALPTITTDAITNLRSIYATLTGTTAGTSITDRGFCYGTSINPSLSGTHVHVGTGEGSFSYWVNLLSGTTYHVRSFSTNSEGTVYGADIELTTPAYTPAISGGKFEMINGKIKVYK